MSEHQAPAGQIRIEQAGPEHAARIGEILVEAYTAAGYFDQWGDDPDSPDSYGAVLRDVAGRASESLVLVALEDLEPEDTSREDPASDPASDASTGAAPARVLGSITMAVHGSPVCEEALPGEAELRMLGVDPTARGRGVASRLLDAAIDAARASGAQALVLLSIEPQEHVERRYTRRGFVRVPERDEHWDAEAVAAGTATPYPIWRLDFTGTSPAA